MIRALVSICVVLALPLAGAAAADVSPSPEPAGAVAAGDGTAALDAAMQRFQIDRPAIERAVGLDVARDLFLRLSDDIGDRGLARPATYSAAAWAETLDATDALDVDAERQLAADAPQPISFAPGLHEDFVRSSVDGTMQPVAVYVPERVDPAGRASLAVVLHGHDQSETALLGQPYLRELAASTGTILVAPYGRGAYDFAEPGETDVRDAIAAARAALPTDPRRTYLAGFSMGAFTVYLIGPRLPVAWKGVMAISGSMMNDDAAAVAAAWRRTPVYVVTGAQDASIPAVYGERSAAYLAAAGVPVSFYEVRGGGHAIRTLMPGLRDAWSDMLSGKVRPQIFPESADPMQLQQAMPGPAVRY